MFPELIASILHHMKGEIPLDGLGAAMSRSVDRLMAFQVGRS
jgi:hypothetical protein